MRSAFAGLARLVAGHCGAVQRQRAGDVGDAAPMSAIAAGIQGAARNVVSSMPGPVAVHGALIQGEGAGIEQAATGFSVFQFGAVGGPPAGKGEVGEGDLHARKNVGHAVHPVRVDHGCAGARHPAQGHRHGGVGEVEVAGGIRVLLSSRADEGVGAGGQIDPGRFQYRVGGVDLIHRFAQAGLSVDGVHGVVGRGHPTPSIQFIKPGMTIPGIRPIRFGTAQKDASVLHGHKSPHSRIGQKR